MRWERRRERLANLTDLIGKAAYRFNGNYNWAALTYELSHRLVRALDRRASGRVEPDKFLLEITTPCRRRLTFNLFSARAKNLLSATTTIDEMRVPFPR